MVPTFPSKKQWKSEHFDNFNGPEPWAKPPQPHYNTHTSRRGPGIIVTRMGKTLANSLLKRHKKSISTVYACFELLGNDLNNNEIGRGKVHYNGHQNRLSTNGESTKNHPTVLLIKPAVRGVCSVIYSNFQFDHLKHGETLISILFYSIWQADIHTRPWRRGLYGTMRPSTTVNPSENTCCPAHRLCVGKLQRKNSRPHIVTGCVNQTPHLPLSKFSHFTEKRSIEKQKATENKN